MCGIAGMIGGSPSQRIQALNTMNAALVHRGPDDAGTGGSGPCLLGMRRLAIFDPAGGHQPMSTEDGRWQLVFNGAIYNHRELRAELESAGIRFHTHCDTEVLLQALVRWGLQVLPRLRGMYAFALWDSREERLLLARDPFGIKPLYHALTREGALVFASEIQALRRTGLVEEGTDLEAVCQYLRWLAVPAPLTLHKNIRALLPGECLAWQAGKLARVSVEKLPAGRTAKSPKAPAPGDAEKLAFARTLNGQLENTMAAHALADVPVGAFLSGGLDSAIVAAHMARHSPNGRLRTFSVGFEEKEFCEASQAAETARHLGTTHHEFVLTARRLAKDLPTLIGGLDHPTGDAVNTYYASLAAREGGVKAVLSGLGADELFGGYPSFRYAPLMARVTALHDRLPNHLSGALGTILRAGTARCRKLADSLQSGNAVALQALQQRTVFTRHDIGLLVPGLTEEELELPHPRFEALLEATAALDDGDAISLCELSGYMTDVLLQDSDTMSMRHSVELRVPFVDAPFLAWLRAQPEDLRFQGPEPKAALLAASAKLLPPALLTRRKRGFTLPMEIWMRRELRPWLDETFSNESLATAPMLDASVVQQLWREFLKSQDNRQWSRIWSLAVLVRMLEKEASA